MPVSAASAFLLHHCWPSVIERYTHTPTFAVVHVTKRVYARAERLEQKLDFYKRPACTQYKVFDLREFGLKYNTVVLDNRKIFIVGHTSKLITNVTFRALQSQYFVMEAIRINLLLP